MERLEPNFTHEPVYLSPHQKRWLYVYAVDKKLEWLKKVLQGE